jgi:hypothetical protein
MYGSSQSLLVRDARDRLWILKINSSNVPSNTLANELIGARLLGLLGIPTPPHVICHIPESFFNDERSWLSGGERPTSGPHFASRYLPCLTNSSVLEHLPAPLDKAISRPETFASIFAFDTWTLHADRRQALYLSQGIGLEAVFIDNSHLFGGPRWNFTCVRRQSAAERILVRNAQVESHLQRAIAHMQGVLPKEIDRALSHLPNGWHTDDVFALRDLLHVRLGRLGGLVSIDYECTKKLQSEHMKQPYVSPQLMSTLYRSGKQACSVSTVTGLRARLA